MSKSRDSLNESLYSQEEFYDIECLKKRRKRSSQEIINESLHSYGSARLQNAKSFTESPLQFPLFEYTNYESGNQDYQQINNGQVGTLVNKTDFEMDEFYIDDLFKLNGNTSEESLRDSLYLSSITPSSPSLYKKKENVIFDINVSNFNSQNQMVNEDSFSNKSNGLFENYSKLISIGRFKKIGGSYSFFSLTSSSYDLSYSQSEILSSSISDQYSRYEDLMVQSPQCKYNALQINKRIRKKQVPVTDRNSSYKNRMGNDIQIFDNEQNLARLTLLYIISLINEKCYVPSTHNKFSLVLGEKVKLHKKLNQCFFLKNYHNQKCNPRMKQEVKKYILSEILQHRSQEAMVNS